jgi:proteasome lid subunit RPN8/RPN11
MAEQKNLVVKRDLKRVITEHALDGARKDGFEVLGWLVGFFTEDTVYICDAVPCTKYKRQTRYSAEADPSEESMLAARFPRNVGIVGLYHSHPFKMEHESAEFRRLFGVSELFHSGTDDAMLKSRASRMKNYVSIVTDIDNISCYMMQRKKPKKIKENLVNSIIFKDHMRQINSKIHLYSEKNFKSDLDIVSMIRAMEENLISQLDREFSEDEVKIQQGPVGNVMRILPFEGDGGSKGSKESLFHIIPQKNETIIKAEMNLAPTIYVPKGYIDSKAASESMKNEIADYIVYLTWNDIDYFGFTKHIVPQIKELEIHLGRITTKFDDNSDMPMKSYNRPKRRMVLSKN